MANAEELNVAMKTSDDSFEAVVVTKVDGSPYSLFTYGLLSAAMLLTVTGIVYVFKFITRDNFFALPRRPRAPLEMDRKKRNEVLKRRFHPKSVPKNLDAIIVGSGMGGLTCAALLSKAGKKVLVLEQHDILGGCTHAYENKGFEFDVGIHYIGNMEKGSMNRVLMDFVTGGQLGWKPIDDEYDSAVFQDDPSGAYKSYGICAGRANYKKKLLSQFPEEKEGIDKYFKLMHKAKVASGAYLIVKILPRPIISLLKALNLHKLIFGGYIKLANQSLADVLNSVTNNEKLKGVLAYCFGDYGTPPSQTSFIMHSFLFNHFIREGGYYPEGGASEIAYHMIPVIEESGGAVLAGVRVEQILVEDGKVFGVRINKFNSVEIRAPLVISDAGMVNTYQHLLPPRLTQTYGMDKIVEKWKVGHACFQLFVGLDGTAEELNLTAKNYWVFTSYDAEKGMNDYLKLSCEDAVDSDIPLLFVSFPSSKDPTWNARYPGKSTCAIVTFSNYKWFDEWKNNPCKRRGVEYDNLKNAFADQAWSQVLKMFPHLKSKVLHMEAGSPITHNHYINSTKGEIYGIDHTKDRFSFENAADMRPETEIENLYLTGQDVFTCGFIGAAMGGVITASKVLDRYLIIDLIRILGKARKSSKKLS